MMRNNQEKYATYICEPIDEELLYYNMAANHLRKEGMLTKYPAENHIKIMILVNDMRDVWRNAR